MTGVEVEALPQLLCGPILRRSDHERVVVWLATSPDTTVAGRVVRLTPTGVGRTLAEAEARRARLGPGLAVHLLALAADAGGFPGNELLGYDIELRRDGVATSPPDLSALSYGSSGLPSFVLRSAGSAFTAMHGSCRLLHGGGEDAFVAADDTLARAAAPSDRPAALFLTGDQVYADDVAGPMIRHVRALADRLMGAGDATSVPDMPSLGTVAVGERRALVLDRARFTSAHAANHLMSFGEFAAMYLCAWSDSVWPETFPTAEVALEGARGPGGAVARRRYEVQRSRLEAARRALPAVRRVLANTPTYMNFDDHDVTDDWNLTRAWRDAVRDSPAGRRVVANALAAYWAFQGWGNDPEAFDETFVDTVSGFLSGAGVAGDDFDALLWDFGRWSYFAPTHPPVLVLDTRTQRGYDSPTGGARLLGADARRRAAELVSRSGYRNDDPLIVVSPVPVFGFELQERRQKYLLDKVGPYEIDFEAWHSNLHGLVDLMRLLVEEIGPSTCLLLSGDVHYGVNARASFEIEGRTLLFTQLVSSGFKHASPAARATLNTIGRLLRRKHERLGWDGPPDCRRRATVADRILMRAVNTDEWADDSPVFLAPRDVKVLGVEQEPDYTECRVYVRPEGRWSSILVGENNIGLVTVDGRRVTHRLVARGERGSVEHVARMHLDEPPTP